MASETPIERLLSAIDAVDVDAMVALFAPDVRLLTVDGQRATGTAAARAVLASFLAPLRSTSHRITAQLHEGDLWIAEVEASYVLRDALELNALPRAFVLRDGPDGIADLRVYGAHERPLSEHRTGEEGMWIGGRWIPPL